MVNCNPNQTPVDTKSKLGDDGDPGTLDHGLQLFSTSTTSLVAYSDADWASFPTTRQSTLDLLVKETVTRAAYTFIISYACFSDNVSAIYLSSNLVQHQRTKQIEIDIHFVRDLVAAGQVRDLQVPSQYQYANIFTKGFPSTLFEEFRTSLSIWCPHALTAGES
ncbi:ribonuclease H-like domain-containing protein [Tanacetum coccineum]